MPQGTCQLGKKGLYIVPIATSMECKVNFEWSPNESSSVFVVTAVEPSYWILIVMNDRHGNKRLVSRWGWKCEALCSLSETDLLGTD